MIINPYRFAVATIANIAYQSKNLNVAGASTRTFTAQDIGTASTDRVTIVGVVAADFAGNGDISTVTIGGNSATLIAKNRNLTSGISIAAIFALATPTSLIAGTTADIVLGFNEAVTRQGIIVWRMTGGATATAFNTATAITGDPTTVSLNIPANGSGVAIALSQATGAAAATWAGLTTEDVDDTFDGDTYTGAHLDFVSAQTGLSVSADWATAPTSPILIAASFGG